MSATLSKFTSLDSGIDRWEELDLSGMALTELLPESDRSHSSAKAKDLSAMDQGLALHGSLVKFQVFHHRIDRKLNIA